MQWIFLILASCCEILWFYCIAYLNKVTLKDLYTFSFIYADNRAVIIGAIFGYVVLGIANMLFFTKAVQKIAPAIAFSVWTGLALVGITLADVIWKGVALNIWQILSVVLILAGITGIKLVADKS